MGELALRRWLPLFGAAIICIIAPLFYSSICFEVWVIPKMFALAFGVMLLWSARVLSHVTTMRAATQRSRITRAMIAMFAAFAISTIGSIDLSMSVFGVYLGQFHGLIQAVLYALIYYGIARNEAVTTSEIVDMTLFGSIAVNGWAVCMKFEWLSSLGQYFGWGFQGARIGSTFGAPIFLGTFVALIMPLSYAWMSRGGWRRFLGAAALAAALGAAWASQSRGGLGSGFAAILLYEALIGNTKSAVQSALFALLLFLMFWHRKVDANSDIGRFEIWRAGLVAWLHHPILGGGPDTFSLLYSRYVRDNITYLYGGSEWVQLSAHNDWLQVACTMGTVGLAAFLYLTFRVFKISGFRWFQNQDGPSLTVFCGLVGVFVQAKVQPIHLVVIAICAALAGSQDRWPIGSEERIGPAPTIDWRIEWRNQMALGLAGLLLAFGVFRVTQRQMRATIYEKVGVVQFNHQASLFAISMFNQAAVENPYQIHYIQKELDALWTVLPAFDPDNAKRAAAISLLTTEHVIKVHPNDPVAHDLRALSLRVLQLSDGSDTIKEAGYEMNLAHQLAPGMKLYVRDAMEIAHETNDVQAFIKNKDDLMRIMMLEKRSGA